MNSSLKKISGVVLGACALLLASAAHAQTTGSDTSQANYDWWPSAYKGYVGLNGGRSEFSQGHGDAYSLYIGGMWNPNWGLELGATDFGRGSNAEAYGFNVSAVGRMPINDTFALFGKLGVLYSRSDTGGARDSGYGETYGVGMDISFNRQWAGVLQYDRSAVHFVTGRDRMNLTSVGLKYRY